MTIRANVLNLIMKNRQHKIDKILYKDYADTIIESIDKELQKLVSITDETIEYRKSFTVVFTSSVLYSNYVTMFKEEFEQLKRSQTDPVKLVNIAPTITINQINTTLNYIKSVFEESDYKVTFNKTAEELSKHNNTFLAITLDWSKATPQAPIEPEVIQPETKPSVLIRRATPSVE